MPATGGKAKRMTSRVRGEAHEYAHGQERPLGSFLVIMGAYGAVAAGMAGFLLASGRRLPDRLAWLDLGLLAVATHRAVQAARLGSGDEPAARAVHPLFRHQRRGGTR